MFIGIWSFQFKYFIDFSSMCQLHRHFISVSRNFIALYLTWSISQLVHRAVKFLISKLHNLFHSFVATYRAYIQECGQNGETVRVFLTKIRWLATKEPAIRKTCWFTLIKKAVYIKTRIAERRFLTGLQKGLFFLKGGGGYTHSGYHKTLSATIACERTSCETET